MKTKKYRLIMEFESNKEYDADDLLAGANIYYDYQNKIDVSTLEIEDASEFFMVTRVCRDDIATRFSDWDGCGKLPKKFAQITDDDMQAIASTMGNQITDMDFWTALEYAVEKILGW